MKRSLMIVALAFSTMAMAAAGAPTDPEIAHIAVTANQIDVDAAKFARTKTRNDEVKQFANTMLTDHTGVIAKATELVKKLKVTPKDNPTSKSLEQNADKAKAELSKKSGADFDKAYVDNEVAYHEAVIGAVDTVLIPNAQNAELKALRAAAVGDPLPESNPGAPSWRVSPCMPTRTCTPVSGLPLPLCSPRCPRHCPHSSYAPLYPRERYPWP